MAIVLPSTWGRDPPGRLPWGVTRGLTNRLPLDDASTAAANSGVIQDIVGNAYGTNTSSGAAFNTDGPSAARSLRFGQGGSTPNPATWPSAPIPQTGWTGTVSFWIWLDQFLSTDGFDVRAVCIGTTNALVVATAGAGTYIGFVPGAGAELSAATTLVLSVWQHIACTWDGSTAKIYYNSTLLSNGAAQGESFNGANYSFGGRTPTPDRGLVGRMADLRLYTGTALTADEINQLYLSAFIQDPGYGYTLPDEGEMPALFTPAAPPPVAASTALGFIEVEW